MAIHATEEARRELAALRSRIEDCRRELGLDAGKPVRIQAKSRDSKPVSTAGEARKHASAA